VIGGENARQRRKRGIYLGNGNVGVIVWRTSNKLILTFNRADL